MTSRLVVIGGDAAGMTAASVAKRTAGDALDVVALERTRDVSYSACGIPYWISGDVSGPDRLVARTAAEHRANGIDLRLDTEAVEIDVDGFRVQVRTAGDGGSSRWLGYDQLVLATGATPRRPPLPGIDAPGVHGVQTLADGRRLLDRLEADRPRTAVVVGGGYIGIEMAEACLQRGLTVTLVDAAAEPMGSLDPPLGRLVREAMEEMGIRVLTGVSVEGFETDPAGRLRAVSTDDGELPADLVVLGLGVRPQADLAAAAGLPLGDFGGVRTDSSMRVRDGVFAAGDCVESWDRVARSWVHVPLGTHANKQGRVAGLNVVGGDAVFPGVVGTAESKVCDLEIARTGLREMDARKARRDIAVATIETTTRAGYFPGAKPMTVMMLADRPSRRLLGAQIVGREGAAIRIDICALALWTEMTVDELAMTDLAYAPPFSSVWDPVQVAARAVIGKLG